MKAKLLAALVLTVALVSLTTAGCAPEGAATPGGTPAGEVIEWRCQTVSPTGNEQWYGEVYMCDAIRDMSNGRLDITPYSAGELVPTGEILESVKAGTLESGQDYPAYWYGIDKAFGPLCIMPFGMGTTDFFNWIWAGGGLEIYHEIFGKHDLMYFPNWVQPMESGYRTNKPIRSLEDFDGLKLRGAGMEVKDVLKTSGAEIISVPPGEIYTALERGVVDGLEYGPVCVDWAQNMQEITKYWCLPGWHQPGTIHGFMMNMDAWNELPDDLKAIVEHAAKSTWVYTSSLMDYNCAEATKNFIDYGIEITHLSDEDLKVLEERTVQVEEATAAENPDYAKVIKSQQDYLSYYREWRELQGNYTVSREPATVNTP